MEHVENYGIKKENYWTPAEGPGVVRKKNMEKKFWKKNLKKKIYNVIL